MIKVEYLATLKVGIVQTRFVTWIPLLELQKECD